MAKIVLKKFPRNITGYKGFFMLHMDNDLEIVENTFTGCRENFINWMRRKYYSSSTQYDKINTHRLYALITLGGSDKVNSKNAWDHLFRQTKKSLKLVNSFERHYKWPLSKIQFIDDQRENVCVPSALFIGCCKWVATPYLVSAYLLLLRAVIRPWFKDDITNEPNHDKLIIKLIEAAGKCKNTQADAMHILKSMGMINILMANYKELFSDNPKSYHWASVRIKGGAHVYNEGIRKLADGKSGDKELCDKCKALIKKVK